MTTFNENPYAKARNMVNGLIFKNNLNKTLDSKFKHKKFSERFSMANGAFIGMGLIAQFASLTTAFTMLSFLFVNINIIARVVCSAALVIMIELIKRESTNDVMKGIFQYKEVERFPALLALIAVSTSIYISIEGAKILPSFFIADAIEESAILKTPDAINEDFNSRIADKETERNTYRNNRLWKGRLKSSDAAIVEQYNEDIKALQVQKEEALKELKAYNEAAESSVLISNQRALERVSKDRMELGKQLVVTAVVFEILFLFSLCFSWWYYTECEKEKNTAKVPAETPIDRAVTAAVPANTTAVTAAVTTAVTGGSRGHRKIGFGNQEEEQERALKIEKVKKEYTRICPNCHAPFIHKSHNHTYCKRSCMLAAKALRDES
jgi:Na+-transporting methylmalonyl-CoA/oxaloacetate decarboxylase gamma subunit